MAAGATLAVILITVTLVGIPAATGRMFPATTFMGLDVSWKTKDEAKEALTAMLSSYSQEPVSVLMGQTSSEYALQQLGVDLNIDATVDSFINSHTITWRTIPQIAHAEDIQAMPVVFSFDKDVLTTQLSSLAAGNTAPKDATLSIVQGVPTIISDVIGQSVDYDAAAQDLQSRVSNLSQNPITLKIITASAVTTADDLAPTLLQAQSILSQPLTLKAAGESSIVDAVTLGGFISVDETVALTINRDGVRNVVTKLANKVDEKATPQKVVEGSTVVLQDGSDGKSIAVDQSVDAIIAGLMSSPPQHAIELPIQTTEAEVVSVKTEAEPASANGKVIVVDISEQRLYAWDSGTLVKSFLISSGLWGTPTPIGTFATYNKIADHVMAGPGYYLPNVPHSMYFTGSYALHGAYWHNNFGNPMSHGCVNLPLDEAAWLFDWTPVGTTVQIIG